MAETRELTAREQRRFEKRCARRYWHMQGIDCNHYSRWRVRCARCLWWSITGKHRAAKRALRARFDVFAACPHESRRPNPAVTTGRKGEICNDCGIGILTLRRPA